MITLEYDDVIEVQNEKLDRIGQTKTNPRQRNPVVADVEQLNQIIAEAFALGARTAKRYSDNAHLAEIWTKVADLCEKAITAAGIISKGTPIPDLERYREAAQFRLALYKKPV
jgi:uncharacterized membrane protein YccC